MSKVCQVTGKKPMYGNLVSHSKRRTRHRQDANIQKRRFWSEDRNRFVTLTVSTAGIRIMNRRGVDKVLGELSAQGVKL